MIKMPIPRTTDHSNFFGKRLINNLIVHKVTQPAAHTEKANAALVHHAEPIGCCVKRPIATEPKNIPKYNQLNHLAMSILHFQGSNTRCRILSISGPIIKL